MNKNIERRSFRCEFRAVDNAPSTIVGYAATFNSLSVELYEPNLGSFRERLLPGAFNRVVEAPDIDVTANVDHDDSRILGRFKRVGGEVKVSSLRLAPDEHGLGITLDIPDTTLGRDISYLMREGIIDQMSFAFTTDEAEERWTVEDGVNVREIAAVNGLYDCSIVVHPAYEASGCCLRSFQKWTEDKKEKTENIINQLERAKRILRLIDR